MLGKTEGRRRSRQQRMRSLDGITDGHELEQGLGVGDGEGSLVCCSPWSPKELDTTESHSNVNSSIIYNCQDTEEI